MTDDGGPAFPRIEAITNTGAARSTKGMSLRDWFAGMALAGITASDATEDLLWKPIAEECYLAADAMLDEREKNQ